MTAVEERHHVPDTAPLPPPRRSRPGATLTLTLLAGLLFFVAAYAALRDADARERVLYLGESLEAGQTLQAASLAVAAVDVGEEAGGRLVAADRRDQLEGMVAAHPLAEGRLLQVGDLREPAAPASHRAMSLPVSRAHALAGDLRVGDRVDVLLATPAGAVFVATDVEVLAADSGAGGALASESATVTLAVDAEVARALADALERGTVHVLRSNGAPPLEDEPLPGIVPPDAAVATDPAAGAETRDAREDGA